MTIYKSQTGFANIWMITAIALIGVSILLLVGGVWSLVNYLDQKNNVDTKIETAAADARKEQADDDETKFSQREKEPNRQFAGPDDYGRVTFDYPKTWSVYIDQDQSSKGAYEAYLNPIAVPSIANSQQYALRVTIEQRDYDKVIGTYEAAVKKGDLSSSSVKIGDSNGARLDGKFDANIRGSAVVFKIRDKTVTIRTDADTFKPDFDALIKTITFNS